MKKVKSLLLLFSILAIIFFGYDKFVELYSYVDAYEIGEVIIIEVKDNEMNDYQVLEEELFKHIEQEKLELLKTYMKENNLKLRCGTYEVNNTYTYEELIDLFKFEKE